MQTTLQWENMKERHQVEGLTELRCEGEQWIHLAQDKDHERGNEPSGSVKGEDFLE
jgi:hypothetical protein